MQNDNKSFTPGSYSSKHLTSLKTFTETINLLNYFEMFTNKYYEMLK